MAIEEQPGFAVQGWHDGLFIVSLSVAGLVSSVAGFVASIPQQERGKGQGNRF
jgi:hypothetical protein